MTELITGMLNTSRYKRSQGKVARQATFAAMAAAIVTGAWKLSEYADNDTGRYLVPLAVLIVGLWIGFRIVNIPRFADFLISVEAEMKKVSWPSRDELFRASLVVIIVIFFMAAMLFVYDIVLKSILGWFFSLGGG